MPAITTVTDEARIVAANVLDAVAGGGTPTVRLGVTGLSRAGKTVFITALVHNLIHGGRLPLFNAYRDGRLVESRLRPQPDDDVPRFDYEAHVRDLVERRVWPQSTKRISELRVVIDYESGRFLKRRIGRGRLNLDIVDYPGEWLLDLALLRKSYAEWSAESLSLSRERHRAGVARKWHAALAGVEADGPEDEATARKLACAFADYLSAARADEHALSMLPPGRFLMPGDLEGSPALTFAPLDVQLDHKAKSGTLAAMMARRYEAYKTHVVKPFFRDHFARLDRQIVLVDMLAALNAGPAALRDLEAALADVLSAFRPGRASWLTAILTRKIDRILFAATKADHVHHSDHENLAGLLQRLTRRAAERASILRRQGARRAACGRPRHAGGERQARRRAASSDRRYPDGGRARRRRGLRRGDRDRALSRRLALRPGGHLRIARPNRRARTPGGSHRTPVPALPPTASRGNCGGADAVAAAYSARPDA